MNLKHIKDETCPHCKARAKSESYNGTHCNGDDFERREFTCGMVIEYEPNFFSARVAGICKTLPVYKNAVAQFAESKQQILTAAAKVLTDEQFESFDKQMRYWRWEPSIPR